jgi:RHS repeat-associated protein
VKKSKKKIGTDEATFEKSYDTSGRVLSIKYLAGTPNEKGYSYEYDVAGNILYIKDNASGNHLVDYSDFTALGQQKIATFPKPNNISVKTTSTYDPPTSRLKTLITQKLSGGIPTDTYQNLDYQQFDGKGNLITLADTLNGITHSYTYDPLDRLLIANGVGTNPYSQNYEYDRIGNIIYKSDFGTYGYDYANKPHAVKSVVTDGPVSGDLLTIIYNYDNKPELVKKNGSNYVQLTYDGNGKRVKKYNYNTGQNVLYFGELYEVRGSAGIIQVFAGNKRVASVLADGRTQFYHTNHLGSASVITDGNGAKKEKMEYFPFGTYREAVDYDTGFPDVFYTFTGQEDDDDLAFYNFKARLYDPFLGKFISPDVVVQNIEDPQTLNRYSYARDNPLIYVDASGKAFLSSHFFITTWAAWDSGYYSLGESLRLGWDAMMIDFSKSPVTGGWSSLSRYAVDTNLHGMGGRLTGGEYQTYFQTQEGTFDFIQKSILHNKLPFAFHAMQDWAVHRGQSMEKLSFFSHPLNTIWHIIEDVYPSYASVVEMYRATRDVIEQAHQWTWYGRSLDFGSRYSLDIGNPMVSLLNIGSTSKEPIFTSNWSLGYRLPTDSYSGSLGHYSSADLGSDRFRLNLNSDLDWYNSFLGGL